MSKKLNILFLTPRFVYPIIGGDRLKPYNILSHLAKKHNVTLVSFYQGGMPPQSFVKEVEKLGVELVSIPLNPIMAGISTLVKLFHKYPLEIAYYLQSDYKREVKRLLSERNFDLAFSFFMRTAEYVKKSDMKKILMAEDCRTLYQKRSFEESNNLKQKMVRFWEYQKLKRYEPEIVNHFDVTTLVTNHDIKAMENQNSKAQYRLLTNGTDVNTFVAADNSKRNAILFAGKLDIWANVLMLKSIVNNIMPIILKEVPDAKFRVVGAQPTYDVKMMAKKYDFIELHADVPEMQPYLQNAALFLHPHSGGSGIQNKLLEAMSCECPVVTTSTGNQGIDGVHGQDLMIANTNEEMAAAAIKILKDKEFANQLGKNARQLMLDTHDWKIIFEQLDDIIDELFPEH